MKYISLFILLLVYNSAFSQWEDITPTEKTYGGLFLTPDTGFSFVENATFFQGTVDGGKNWTGIAGYGDFFGSQGLWDFATTSVGFAFYRSFSEVDTFYRTKDGGKTWDAIEMPKKDYFPVGGNIHDFLVKNKNEVFISYAREDTQQWVYKTNDMGDHWHKVCDSLIRNITFADDKVGYGIYVSDDPVDNFILMKTTDGGESWKPESLVPPYAGTFGHFEFVSEDTGFASVGPHPDAKERGMFRTVNGGQTWFKINNGFPNVDTPLHTVFDFDFLNSKIGFAVVTNAGIYKTFNGGGKWYELNSPSPFTYVRYVQALDEQNIFLYPNESGPDLRVFKTTNGGGKLDTTTSIHDVAVNTGFLELYPNPAGHTVNLNFTTSQAQPVTITVLNSTGQAVTRQELVNNTPGSFTHTFDVKAWSRGLYIFVVQQGAAVYRKKVAVQ